MSYAATVESLDLMGYSSGTAQETINAFIAYLIEKKINGVDETNVLEFLIKYFNNLTNDSGAQMFPNPGGITCSSSPHL